MDTDPMKPPVRQAHLQRDLLLELDRSPARSVLELAERLLKTRPAVSRALAALTERDLVLRQGRTWQLTPEGRHAAELEAREPRPVDSLRMQRSIGLEAAAAARTISGLDTVITASRLGLDFMQVGTTLDTAARIADMVPKVTFRADWTNQLESVSKLAAEGILRSAFALDQIEVGAIAQAALAATATWKPSVALETLSARFAEQAAFTSGTQEMVSRLWQRMDVLGPVDRELMAGHRLSEVMSHELTTAMRALADTAGASLGAAVMEAAAAQRVQLEAITGGTASKAWWTPMVAETLPRTAAMLSDLATMEATFDAARGPARRLAGPLSLAATSVVTSHRRHMTATLGGLATAPPAYRDAAITTLVMPTASTAEFVGGARLLLEPRDRRDQEPDVALEARTVDLAGRLASIHPSLRHTFLGAWERVAEGGNDWQRAAAHGAREVLGQVLTRMVPDAPPDPLTGRPTRKTRLRVLLGSSETQLAWADAQVAALEAAFTLLSAEAHEREATRFRSRFAMVGMLRSVEGVLWVILEAGARER